MNVNDVAAAKRMAWLVVALAVASMLAAGLAFGADRVTSTSHLATVGVDDACAVPIPKRKTKRIVLDGACVVVRQQRVGERSCEFVTGPETLAEDMDRLVALCRTTKIEAAP